MNDTQKLYNSKSLLHATFDMLFSSLPQRKRSRPKKTWMEVVRNKDRYEKCNLSEDLDTDRLERRNRIQVAGPKIVGTRF